ncbi:MAG: HAD hydrolase-like protein [Oscillospiraceae bacterium]|nr:HAD hydrolase-like protein [Oscillospiraceae bacterium]
MPYDLCLFDLDGTLTDPAAGIVNSYRHALSAFGIPAEAEQLVKFIGPPLREVFGQVYGFSETDTERVVAKYREYFAVTGLFENTVYPGVPELLQALRDNGKTLAVATSKAGAYACRVLEHFGLDGFFAFVSGDAMDGSLSRGGKREIIRLALEALDPGREKTAVMIGDRKHDIHGARDAGIDSIGVAWGYGARGELEEAGAARIAETPEELGRMILEESLL